MKTIETRFIPATNTKPARVKAIEPDGISITMPWDHGIVMLMPTIVPRNALYAIGSDGLAA